MCLGVCVGEVTGGKGACRARIISMSQCPLKCMCVWWFSRCLKCPKIISTRVLVETRCSSSSPDSHTGSHIFYTFILLSYFKVAFVSSEHVPSVVKCEFTSFSK